MRIDDYSTLLLYILNPYAKNKKKTKQKKRENKKTKNVHMHVKVS